MRDTRVEIMAAAINVQYIGLFSPFLVGHFFGKFGLTPFRRSGGTFFIPASAREGPHFGGEPGGVRAADGWAKIKIVWVGRWEA